jgi:hypothetical protein
MEAITNGFVEGIALDTSGNVSEGSGENLFIVRNSVLYTPPLGRPILTGITRDSVMKLAHKLGYEVVERVIPRAELYVADEVFFTGTAAEITPIRSIDPYQNWHRQARPNDSRIANRILRHHFGREGSARRLADVCQAIDIQPLHEITKPATIPQRISPLQLAQQTLQRLRAAGNGRVGRAIKRLFQSARAARFLRRRNA